VSKGKGEKKEKKGAHSDRSGIVEDTGAVCPAENLKEGDKKQTNRSGLAWWKKRERGGGTLSHG